MNEEFEYQYNDNNLKLEIEAITQDLQHYEFGFMEVAKYSPKAGKTKESCAKAILFMLNNPNLVVEMRNSKQLPIKIIEKNAKVPRKLLERHRKYIIAAVEILIGDYPYLSEYLNFIKKEKLR
jgi:RNA polymerase sigma factor